MVRRTLQRWLPTDEAMRKHPSLRWLAPVLRRPWLFQLSRRRVAAGAAIGVFFGFLIPVLQIACAAAVAVMLRANVAVAAAATLVSNPFTYVPIYALAYRTGAALLGERVDAAQAQALAAELDAVEVVESNPLHWWQRIVSVGKPLFLGFAIFAVIGAGLTWIVVNLVWTAAVRLRWRARGSGNGNGSGNGSANEKES